MIGCPPRTTTSGLSEQSASSFSLSIAYHVCSIQLLSPNDTISMPVATTTPHPHLPPTELGRLSPWQETVRSHPLLNKGKDDALPESAAVVIVGSGMCGKLCMSLS